MSEDGQGRITEFLRRLKDLTPGERAMLKRNAGKDLAEAQGAIGLFFRLLPHGVPKYHEPWYFLVATLFPLTDEAAAGNLGDSLRRLRRLNPDREKGLDRRFEVLLDASAEQLRYYLRQAVRMLASNDLPIEWSRLLTDLTQWTHPSRHVQQHWARSYFRSETTEEN